MQRTLTIFTFTRIHHVQEEDTGLGIPQREIAACPFDRNHVMLHHKVTAVTTRDVVLVVRSVSLALYMEFPDVGVQAKEHVRKEWHMCHNQNLNVFIIVSGLM